MCDCAVAAQRRRPTFRILFLHDSFYKPYTQNPETFTQNPKLKTINLNPKPSTLNPKLSTPGGARNVGTNAHNRRPPPAWSQTRRMVSLDPNP
jgi:hypothetical protein